MSVLLPEQEKETDIRLFIDWDKNKNTFYNNVYLENCKLVIKMRLISKEDLEEDIKIKKFDLGKYTFLINY